VSKIAKKAACRSVFSTIWHVILSAELTKHTPSDRFLAILPTGKKRAVYSITLSTYMYKKKAIQLLVNTTIKKNQNASNK